MGDAARIVLAPIERCDADALVRAHHYSGKPYCKSVVHLGVFLHGRLLGAMQWGHPLDVWNVVPLVRDTRPGEVVELNRMAFAPELPRNSESRALGIAARLFTKHAPWVQWLLSYADERSGTGTIYRAAGWWLTAVKRTQTFYKAPDGAVISSLAATLSPATHARYGIDPRAQKQDFLRAGLEPMRLRQCRYILPLREDVRERLTVPILDYAHARVAGTAAPPQQGVRPDPCAS